MTALPLRDFSAAEQDKLAAIEAAPAAAESWDRVRMSPDGHEIAVCRGPNIWRVTNGGIYRDRHVEDWTPMQVAVLSGPSSDAEQAVERVLALADDLDDGSEWGTVEHPGYEIRDRIRAAVAGDA
jgi:hypothetical protein